METFLQACALALAFEGISFALFPRLMKMAMLEAASRPENSLRGMGMTALAGSITLALLARYLF